MSLNESGNYYLDTICGRALDIEKNPSIKKLRNFYSLVKELSPYFYEKGEISYLYNSLVCYLIQNTERLFNNKYILDTSFSLDLNKPTKINKNMSNDDVLWCITNGVRKYLISRFISPSSYEINNTKVWQFDTVNKCKVASVSTKMLCDNLNIECYVLKICPGYCENALELFDGLGFHYANIIYLNHEWYLIDTTYSQFFNVGRANIGRLGLMNYSTPALGLFMLRSEDKKSMALQLLKNGYLKLDEEKFKMYMDGFTLSFRNGLFLKYYGDDYYTSDYSVDDYIKFLRFEKSQVEIEGREVLGYQKRPI